MSQKWHKEHSFGKFLPQVRVRVRKTWPQGEGRSKSKKHNTNQRWSLPSRIALTSPTVLRDRSWDQATTDVTLRNPPGNSHCSSSRGAATNCSEARGVGVTTDASSPAPCVTFRRVVVSLWGPGQSPVLPFACCVGSLRFVGRCGPCSCWCRFRVGGPHSWRTGRKPGQNGGWNRNATRPLWLATPNELSLCTYLNQKRWCKGVEGEAVSHVTQAQLFKSGLGKRWQVLFVVQQPGDVQ